MVTRMGLRFLEGTQEVFRLELPGIVPVPSRGDFVCLMGKRYQVYEIEWIYDSMGGVVTVQVGEVI